LVRDGADGFCERGRDHASVAEAEIAAIFQGSKYKSETRLLLVVSHIIGDYADDAPSFDKVLLPNIVDLDERVQASCVSTAFNLSLKADANERPSIEGDLSSKLDLLSTSQYAEVQDIASLTSSIVEMLYEDGMDDALGDLVRRLTPDDEAEDPAEIARPPDLELPVDLFQLTKDDVMDLHGFADEVPRIVSAGRRKLLTAAEKRLKKVAKRPAGAQNRQMTGAKLS
jgi:hypothetical protein